jgi:hypothetical protein
MNFIIFIKDSYKIIDFIKENLYPSARPAGPAEGYKNNKRSPYLCKDFKSHSLMTFIFIILCLIKFYDFINKYNKTI